MSQCPDEDDWFEQYHADCMAKEISDPQQEDKKIGRLKFNWDMPSDWVISKINEIIDRLNPLL